MKKTQIGNICSKRFTVHIVLVNGESSNLRANTYHVHFLKEYSIHYWEKKINKFLLCKST